ncbi:CGNR zinc finger domain-containing protein [Nocardia sp. CA-151230]|uniref:CGNR zinc finger domain-containing protein n=1 Tax=Nocardia sp. CA-151230 TaxID=3239982 RepID=UPI003D8F9D0E
MPLGVLATNVIHILAGSDRGRVKNCEGPGCAGLFLDTTRGANRRWCSTNTCGDKVKKSRLAAGAPGKAQSGPPTTSLPATARRPAEQRKINGPSVVRCR